MTEVIKGNRWTSPNFTIDSVVNVNNILFVYFFVCLLGCLFACGTVDLFQHYAVILQPYRVQVHLIYGKKKYKCNHEVLMGKFNITTSEDNPKGDPVYKNFPTQKWLKK